MKPFFVFCWGIVFMGGFFFPMTTWGAGKTVRLSVEEFTEQVIKKSLASRTLEDQFAASRWDWMASRRGLTWPSLNAAANRTRTGSNSDLGTETEGTTDNLEVSLSQPFLTGTQLAVSSDWSMSRTETETAAFGEVPAADSIARSRSRPAITTSLTQPLFLFVSNPSYRTWKQIRLNWETTQDNYQRDRLAQVLDARSTYFNLLYLLQRLEVEKRKYRSAQLVHRATLARVRSGQLASFELTRADIEAAENYGNILNSENQVKQAFNEAKNTLLLPPDTQLVLTSTLTYTPLRWTLEELWQAALRFNPTLKASERQVPLTRMSLDETRESDNPSINLAGSYTRTRNRSNDAQPLEPYGWSATAGVSWPLFNAGQNQLQVLSAQVALINAERSLEETRRQLRVNLENAYLEVKRTEEQILNYGRQRESMADTLTAIRLRYQSGLVSLTDVFQTEDTARERELTYINLLLEFNRARDTLSQHVGFDISERLPSEVR